MTQKVAGMPLLKMKYTLLLTLVLTGCFYQTTNQSDIQTAIKACGSLEQVAEIRADALGKELVQCTNRKIVWLDETVYAR